MKTGIENFERIRTLAAGKNELLRKKMQRFIHPDLRGSALLFLVSMYVTFSCLCNTAISGGGTDFPNTRTVAGRIVHENGTPAPFTDVRLLPEDYVPTDSQSERCSKIFSTDSSGNYEIKINNTGNFNLYAVNYTQHTSLLIRSIEVTSEDIVLQVKEAALAPPGVIKIVLPDSMKTADGVVYLRGTCFSTTVSSADEEVVIDSVPSGIIPALYFAQNDRKEELLLQDSTGVVPLDTTIIAPENGPNSLKLILNTTGTGADIDEDVYDFPLAIRFSLLPVSMENFLPDGSDLVITRFDNVRLPYEIELWDRGKKDALIWVKIDTLSGGNDMQSIYLFWGKRGFTSEPIDAVFDTAAGFSAVWHLNGGCTDATENNHDGVRDATVTDMAGILGGAQRFSGNNRITINGLINTPSSLTLSAWAKLDTADRLGGEVVSIGDAALIRMDDKYNNRGCQGAFYSSPGAPDTMTHNDISSGTFLAGTGWHYFAYIYDAAAMRQRFYIDGILSKEEQVTTFIHYDSIGAATIIGAHGNGNTNMDFTGCIDEVSVARTARSAAWVKLCYLTQCNNSKLIVPKSGK